MSIYHTKFGNLHFGKSFDTARDKGGLLDWGDHEARTLEDMGYPNWVADKGLCPGLPRLGSFEI